MTDKKRDDIFQAVKDMQDAEAERLREEHDAMFALVWAFVCFLAAIFTVGCLYAGGCLWGGDQ